MNWLFVFVLSVDLCVMFWWVVNLYKFFVVSQFGGVYSEK